jgi:HAMP domain-containing protein
VSFSRRLFVGSACLGAIVLAIGSAAAYLSVRAVVRGEVDSTLRERAGSPATGVIFTAGVPVAGPPTPGARISVPATPVSSAAPDATAIGFSVAPATVVEGASDWTISLIDPADPASLKGAFVPVDTPVKEVAAGKRAEDLRTVERDGRSYRAITTRFANGTLLQAARPLDETERILSRLAWVLVAITLGGSLLAGLGGRALSSRLVGPLRRMVDTTEGVTATRDLSRRVDEGGPEELARLGRSFNAMLGSLDEALRSQRQLVVDASHECARRLRRSVRTSRFSAAPIFRRRRGTVYWARWWASWMSWPRSCRTSWSSLAATAGRAK